MTLLNDINIFDTLPDDIIWYLMDTMDLDTIFKSCKLFNKIMTFCSSNLKQILYNKSRSKYNLNYNTLTIPELYCMCRLINDPHFIPFVINIGNPIFDQDDLYEVVISINYTEIQQIYEDFTDMKMISSRSGHTTALSKNKLVYVIGNNQFVQSVLSSSRYFSLNDAINRYSIVHIPQIPQLTRLMNIISVSIGFDHSLLLNNKGEVFVSARNIYGQLGLGHNDDIYIPEK